MSRPDFIFFLQSSNSDISRFILYFCLLSPWEYHKVQSVLIYWLLTTSPMCQMPFLYQEKDHTYCPLLISYGIHWNLTFFASGIVMRRRRGGGLLFPIWKFKVHTKKCILYYCLLQKFYFWVTIHFNLWSVLATIYLLSQLIVCLTDLMLPWLLIGSGTTWRVICTWQAPLSTADTSMSQQETYPRSVQYSTAQYSIAERNAILKRLVKKKLHLLNR